MIFLARMCDEGSQSPKHAPQYIAVDAGGDLIWIDYGLDDATGIARLRTKFPGAQFTCSPELSQAATAAGLPVAELPERELKAVAASAVLARHGVELAKVEVSLVVELLEALGRLARTEMWKEPAAAPAFEVVCAELQPHRWVARLLPLGQPMVALMPPGAAYTIKGPEEIDFVTSRRMLTVALNGARGHTLDLLQRAFGLDGAPLLAAIFGNRLLTPSPNEVALLAAAVTSLAAHDGDGSILRAHVGEKETARLTAELRAVPPGREPFEGQVLGSDAPPRRISLRAAFQASAAPKDVPVVSRGAPCPCGSGEKYKRCHGANPPAGGDLLPARAEVEALEDRLWDVLTAEEHALARQQFPVRDAIQIDELARLYTAWVLYDFRPPASEPATERFLRIHRKAMDARVRTYLEAQRSGRVSVWRIQGLEEGWVQLEDAFGAGTFRVRSRLPTRTGVVAQRDALLARLFAVPGEVVLGASHRVIMRGAAVDQLVEGVQAFASRHGLSADDLAKPEIDLSGLLVKHWHELASEPVKLELVKDEP